MATPAIDTVGVPNTSATGYKSVKTHLLTDENGNSVEVQNIFIATREGRIVDVSTEQTLSEILSCLRIIIDQNDLLLRQFNAGR